MTGRAVRVDSYFSLPTDLAAEFRRWPEFVDGVGYDVRLQSDTERISVSLELETKDDSRYVLVVSLGEGSLFHAVLGRVVHAMAAHSDSVWVTSWEANET